MTYSVKRFIEKNIDLIEENKWDELYEKSKNSLKEKTGQFTEFILEAGIHPEYFMSKIPPCFLDGSKIKSFIIPENITEIGGLGFANCGKLVDITIPNNVTTIGKYAFYSCSNLANVVIGNGVTSIGSWAFGFTSKLRDITIPANVKYIGTAAFAYSYLDAITIENPDIVISSCFCKFMHVEIQFAGTKKQWKKVSKGNFAGVTYICNCIDGILKKEW